MSAGNQGGKLVIIGLFVAAVIGAGVFIATRGGDEAGKADGEKAAKGADTKPTEVVTLPFLYSTEKKAWIRDAVADFEKANPGIKVDLQGKGSLDAVRELVDGQVKPVLWSPADHVALNLAASDWQQKYGAPLFAEEGDDAPQPLVLTPLVFVAWQDRGDVLTEHGKVDITWQRLHTVLSANEGWPAIGGQADWGFVKLGHTNPTRSNSGLQAVILMAYDFHGKRAGLQVGDALDQGFQSFIKTVEKGVPAFGSSTGTFMKEMVLYGPSKYDVVVTYENLAIEQLPNAQGRWGNLRIYYPKQTMWSSHPIALIKGDWVTDAQRDAARKLMTFLRGTEAQTKALQYGFRPSDPSIPLIGKGARNPFDAAKAFGARIDIPSVVEPPPGPVVHNLMEMWSRLVGR